MTVFQHCCVEDLRHFARERIRTPRIRIREHDGAMRSGAMTRAQCVADELFVFVFHRGRKSSGGFSFVKEKPELFFMNHEREAKHSVRMRQVVRDE